MPSKRRRTELTTRRRKKTEEFPSQFFERYLEKIDSDIQTIPDHTFGKIYSTQIIEEIPSPNPSSIIAPKIIASRKKNKRNNRKISKT
jgi:ubiquinone biosynthesis protein Coq4